MENDYACCYTVRMRKGNTAILCAIVVALLPVPRVFAADAAAPKPIEAITRPSADVTLSYVRPGKVGKVLVKWGQAVKKGDPLVKQDDSAEWVRVKLLEIQSLDETRIKAAEAQHAQKKVELERLKQAERPPLELDRATLDVTIAQLSVNLAKLEHGQDKLRHDEAKREWERMTIKSPVNGTVQRLFVEEGESVDTLQPVIRVLQIDPLWIDVPAPREQGTALKMGQEATVHFGKSGPTATGKVTYIASEADSASNTLTIRVEVPNPATRQAGEHVTVTFSSPKIAGEK